MFITNNYHGIEKETPRNLAIAIVIGDSFNSSNKTISSNKYYKILHIQFIIEKLLTGFYNCTDLHHSMINKFKVERTPQYVRNLVNEIMTFFGYNNGTNYTVEKYNLLLDKIFRDQERINDQYNIEIFKDEHNNCYYYSLPSLEVVSRVKKPVQLIPKLKVVQNDKIHITKSIEANCPNYDYFVYLFQLVKQNKQENLIDFVFPVFNQYLSFSMDDLMGTLENFEENTFLQFSMINEKQQWTCICKLLNILSEQ